MYSIAQYLFVASHKMNILTPVESVYHFLGVHRSNPFVSNLMFVYEISSYVDITSIA